MQKLSYVIPCYRSEHTLAAVVEEITRTMAALPQYDYEIVLVNDCSPDGTLNTIRSLVAADPHVQGVDLARNFGQHAALMAGFHQCSGDIIVCLDDDGQTPADEVGKLLDKIEAGYDVVYASYDNKRQAGWRNLGSWVNSKMTEIMLGKPPELVVNSYFAARRFVVDEMLRYEHCYPYVIGLVLRSTKHICNVPVHHRAREEGRSGYTLGKLLGLWMNGFTSFSVKPLRIASYFGTLSAVAGFLYMIYIIINHFTRHTAPLGWASTTALLLLLGGVILLVLGLIGEYVGRIYMCANNAPQYVAREYLHHEEASR
ncbi:glycosyltransferase family 2 protein [uncultured Subdoligranulum sp.]|uniref:glycosyltransferase family 2 protein n=1 Tax=uncultured Subdoligranulum sp. TaxID=512298 RepID=UPI00320B8137